MLLLRLFSELFPQHLRVIYINHQLQSASDAWGKMVEQYCQQLNIPYQRVAVDVATGNLEAQAREARYQAFQQHLKPHEILVLAHHQQDQAETVILRLLSGSGVQGLSAMKALDVRENLSIWRPFLDISREQLASWTAQLAVPYIDDPTNFDVHYDRAWCRQELWTVLRTRYPKMQQAISRSSYLMQDADEILQEVLQQDLQYCGDAKQLDLKKLHNLSLARQRQLLSVWMRGDDVYRPSFDMVERLQHEVIQAKPDAQAVLHYKHWYYVRYQQMIYRLDQSEYCADQFDAREMNQSIILYEQQKMTLSSGDFQIQATKMGLAWSLLNQPLQLTARQGGEKIHLYGRVGTWPLKKAIQEAQIFPWLRHRIQILSIDNVMLGVFTPNGFWLAQSIYCEIDGWQPNLIS